MVFSLQDVQVVFRYTMSLLKTVYRTTLATASPPPPLYLLGAPLLLCTPHILFNGTHRFHSIPLTSLRNIYRPPRPPRLLQRHYPLQIDPPLCLHLLMPLSLPQILPTHRVAPVYQHRFPVNALPVQTLHSPAPIHLEHSLLVQLPLQKSSGPL